MRRIVMLAALAMACGVDGWRWSSDRVPYVIHFSDYGECDGADRIIDTESTRTCIWGCAVVSYNGEPPCTPVAKWTHEYDRAPGVRWYFRHQSWRGGCWEPE
jgi:hypothetical protein